MSDWQRDELVEILLEAKNEWSEIWYRGDDYLLNREEFIADYLLAHGVSVVPAKVREAEK